MRVPVPRDEAGLRLSKRVPAIDSAKNCWILVHVVALTEYIRHADTIALQIISSLNVEG
jgi:hypothetical protein